MGEFIIYGPESEQFLNYVCSNKIENIKIGKAQYNLLINKNGGIIDDLIVGKTSSFEYMLVVNAANIEKDYDWIKKNIIGFNCKINDRSDDLGLISVQGPNSTKLLDKFFMDVNIDEITRFGFKKIEDKDHYKNEGIISKTGYTGSEGYEIYIDNEDITVLCKSTSKFK